MDGGAWWATVHGVTKSWTRLSDFTFTLHFHALEEEMATHSSVLAWRIPGTAGPGGLPSMGSHRVGHDWSDLAPKNTSKKQRRKWKIYPFECRVPKIARRDKKAFLSEQCKEIEENNRRGKTRDLFKKIRDTKGTFHAKMGSIKNRNSMDLTEAEDIKKRWQEYTEVLYKKDLHDPDNHKGVITPNT